MRHLRVPSALAVVLLVLVLPACEQGSDSVSPLPTAPSALLGGLLGGSSGSSGSSGYTYANDPIVPQLVGVPLSASALIGITGGSVDVLGHRLAVPPRAVLEPTLFTLVVLPTGNVEVHLGATISTLLGRVLNVGSSGFRRPVTVTLTYSRSTNVTDPASLVVVRVKSGGVLEPLPSQVNQANATVSANLDHFSRYALMFPD